MHAEIGQLFDGFYDRRLMSNVQNCSNLVMFALKRSTKKGRRAGEGGRLSDFRIVNHARLTTYFCFQLCYISLTTPFLISVVVIVS
jgi:hypothetical protein